MAFQSKPRSPSDVLSFDFMLVKFLLLSCGAAPLLFCCLSFKQATAAAAAGHAEQDRHLTENAT